MRCALLIALLFFFLSPAFAEIKDPHIVVYGSAETAVTPDELRWSVMVKTSGEKVSEVTKDHLLEVEEVLLVLKDYALGENEVATSNMQLRENWAYRNNSRVRDGFYASTTFAFKTNDFKSYAEFWSRLTDLKNVSVNAVNFALSNREEVEDQTKIKAIKAGREKAIRFARALGSTIEKPLLIEELVAGGPGPQPVYSAVALEQSAGARQPVSPGREIVISKVKLIFELNSE